MHMHKWWLPAVLTCTSKVQATMERERRRHRWMGGQLHQRSASDGPRHLDGWSPRPHMPARFPPLPGTPHGHKDHPVVHCRLIQLHAGPEVDVGPTVSRIVAGRCGGRVAVVGWLQLGMGGGWGRSLAGRTGRCLCFLPNRATSLERLLCMEAPRFFYYYCAFCIVLVKCPCFAMGKNNCSKNHNIFFMHVYAFLSQLNQLLTCKEDAHKLTNSKFKNYILKA